MPKFRVPSSSASITSAPTRNTHTQTRKPQAASRHVRAHKLDKAKAAVKDAAKRVHRTKRLVEPCIVFVGNFGPEVDENALRTHFSRYGKIITARIHCCGGVAMTVKPPPASYHENMRVRQYAMVTFESKSAGHRACNEDNTLDGHELVVSTAVSDLPEVREKITKRLDDYRARMEPPDVHRAQQSALRSLKIEPTVLLDARYEKQRKRKRLQVMGVSLYEGIM
ncbi:hypothetical protein EV363DRAFT_1314243 [Boletus edulis]|nr:hypothetical protein EV363DRAFT_1314243 [Boletus edulis]